MNAGDYASATEYEIALLDADDELSRQMRIALDAGNHGILNDLLDEKIAIEALFQESRTHTWFAWMSANFPEAMAPYADGRPAA